MEHNLFEFLNPDNSRSIRVKFSPHLPIYAGTFRGQKLVHVLTGFEVAIEDYGDEEVEEDEGD